MQMQPPPNIKRQKACETQQEITRKFQKKMVEHGPDSGVATGFVTASALMKLIQKDLHDGATPVIIPNELIDTKSSLQPQGNVQAKRRMNTVAVKCYCGAWACAGGDTYRGFIGKPYCSQGCDWSGLTPATDDCDSALDSGCECDHHKVIRALTLKKHPQMEINVEHPWKPTSISIDFNHDSPQTGTAALVKKTCGNLHNEWSELHTTTRVGCECAHHKALQVAWGGDSDEDEGLLLTGIARSMACGGGDEDDGLLLTDIAMSIEQPSPHTPSAPLPHGAHQHTQLVKPTDGLSKRDLAMLKLPTYKRTREHEALWAIEDLIGPCSSWPEWIRKIYWMKKLDNRDALRVVTFGLGNSLPPHLIFEWLRVRRVAVDWVKFRADMKAVKKSMGLDGVITFFYWDLRTEEYCFMNGLPRNNFTMAVKGPSIPAPP